MNIEIIITGGTIDKIIDKNSELNFESSQIPKMIKQANLDVDYKITPLIQKDSLEFTDIERELILNACIKSESKNIIITHGTDTMINTAQILEKHIKNKTIVLFGAMIPFCIKKTDAMFNFGYALSAVQKLPTGIYICMNGKTLSGKNIKKNKQRQIFEN